MVFLIMGCSRDNVDKEWVEEVYQYEGDANERRDILNKENPWHFYEVVTFQVY